MENTNITNVILEKKIDGYSFNEKDFVAPQEITVTITLSEYRNLIQEVATKKHDIEKAEKDRWTREEEIRSLKTQVSELKSELYEIQKCNGEKDENK